MSYQYIIAIHLEATCFLGQSSRPGLRKSETIEIAAILMSLTKGSIESEFQRYVKPTERPKLSAYCTSVTGIAQSTLDNSSTIDTVLSEFKDWIRNGTTLHGLRLAPMNGVNCIFVAWSEFDFKLLLLNELNRKKLPQPNICKHFIDLQLVFRKKYHYFRHVRFTEALHKLGVRFVETKHSCIGDARYLANLTYNMHRDGVVLEITDTIDACRTDVDWTE